MDLTIVIPHLAEWVWRHWHIIFPEKIGSIAEVSVQRTREAALVSSEVETEVKLVFLLPTEALINIRSRSPWLDESTIAPQVVTTWSYTHEVEVVVTRHVTSYTITETKLHLIEVFYISHKLLALDIPATRDRREHTPLSEQWICLRTELRRTLETYRSTEEITLIVVVHYTSEERSQFIFVLVATHVSVGISTFFLTFTHTKVVVEKVIKWEVRVVCIEALAKTSLVRLTHHSLECVIVPLTNIVERILYYLLCVRTV